MKIVYKIFLIVVMTIFFSSCEDVIDVDVPSQEPRLVVEADINWVKGTSGNNQEIMLSLSTDYFSEETFVPALGADVNIINLSNNSTTNFIDNNNGIYSTTSFLPEIGVQYRLEISYNNKHFTAEETFMPVTPVKKITQSTSGGFDDNLIEVNVFFDDPPLEENYYLINFQDSEVLLPFFSVVKDEFFNGNEMSIFYENDREEDDSDGLNPGDEIGIELIGISKQYYNYMSLLLSQTEGQGPFESTPAPLNGNCINIEDSNKPAFGYFRLTEVDEATYIVQ